MNILQKTLKLLMGAIFISIAAVSITLSYSITLTDFAEIILKRVTLTHYRAGGNNFGGLFILTQLEELDSPKDITLNSNTITGCKKQLR